MNELEHLVLLSCRNVCSRSQ